MKKNYTLGVMLDLSRNAVKNLSKLENIFALLHKIGYNCVMLYMEDTYEVEGEPYFGYMRGRYSTEELRAIDSLGIKYSIEVIPCIQTLAHLNNIERWKVYPFDDPGILMVDDERNYTLIENMFKTLSKCFTSRRIHIGMDEAHNLGRGKHLDRFGYETVDVIMKRHLGRICDIAKDFGYELMIWSDMYFRPWNGGQYSVGRMPIPEEYKSALPESVIPVYWDYYNTDEKIYADMIGNHKELSDKSWFAGGIWTWGGVVPHNLQSLKRMIPAIDAAEKGGMNNIVFTLWGDNGGECSPLAVLPDLFYLAEYVKGNRDEESIKAKFKRIIGIDFDDFLLLDVPNYVSDKWNKDYRLVEIERIVNPSTYMLFSDPFNGFFDYTVKDGAGEIYKEYSSSLRRVARTSRKFGYLFETEAALCDVLLYKYELGRKTRAAYRKGDLAELLRLAECDYVNTLKALKKFHSALERQWYLENKPSGFDIQDIRLGGLEKRIESCRKRLIAYATGKLDRIEELECEILPFGSPSAEEGEAIYHHVYRLNASCNVL